MNEVIAAAGGAANLQNSWAEGLEALAEPIDSLQLLQGNPRVGDVDAVAASLRRFGQRKPVVARRADRVVIAGNHTLQAARQLGWDEIAVVWVDDDDETAKAFALADNRTGDLGSYDDQALAAMIQEVRDFDAELLDDTGWHEDDVDELLASLEPTVLPTMGGDADDVPESAPAKTVKGDVWLLGPHRVMCGDGTSPSDLDALTIDNDGDAGLDGLLAGAVDGILAASRPGIPVYMASPPGPNSVTFASSLRDQKLFRQRLVWVKDTFVLGHSDYHYRHEDIYLGYTPGGEGRRGRGGERWYGDHAQTTVLEFPKPSSNADHPTMKPVALIEYCLTNSSKSGDVVLDIFGGSGSTLIAAHALGRVARLMELDPRYVDVICRRYQEATGDLPIAESTGRPHDFTQEA